MLSHLFLWLVCLKQMDYSWSTALPRLRYPRDSGVITLADGQKLTGLNIHLSLPNRNQIKAYFGIRYASLGTAHLSASKRMATGDVRNTAMQFDTSAIANLNKTTIQVPASPHRFSHSVASFFYEAPSGVHAKTILPPVCPQPSWNIYQMETELLKSVRNRWVRLEPFLNEQSEDCLTLNVYVPQPEPDSIHRKSMPVLLFVHGESYEHGTGNAYDLSVMASFAGCIGITMNYRLGIMGFLSLKDGQSNGNFALFDLQAAIMWIRNNVASFGGDPNQMTLMGYGHGAALVHLFSLSKMAQGIGGKGIKRIILLGGSGLAPWALANREDWLIRELARQLNVSIPQTEKDASKAESSKISARVNNNFPLNRVLTDFRPTLRKKNSSSLNTTDKQPSISEQLLKLLKELPTGEILELQKNLKMPPFTTLLGPVISHHLFPGFLTSYSGIKIEKHESKEKTPFKRGRPKLEPTLFSSADLLVGTIKQPASHLYKHSEWQDRWSDALLHLAHALYPSNWKPIAELLSFVYMKTHRTEVRGKYPGSSDQLRLEQEVLELLSDGLFLSPTVQTIQLHHALKTLESKSRGSRADIDSREPRTYFTVFQSDFTAATERESNTGSSWIAQYDDLAYYFGAPLVSPNRLDPFTETYSESERRISLKILQFLANFVHSGNPNKPNPWPNNEKSSVYWPEYDEKTESYLSVDSAENQEDKTMRGIKGNMDEDLKVKHGFRKKELAIWSHLLPRIAGLSLNPESINGNKVRINYFGDLHGRNRSNSNECNCTTSETWAPKVHSYETNLYWLNLRQRQRGEDEATVNNSIDALEKMLKESMLYRHKEQHDTDLSFDFRLPQLSEDLDTFGNSQQRISHEEMLTVPQSKSTGMLRFHKLQQSKLQFKQQNDSHTLSTRSALLWTIAVGSVLFLLNAMVFMGIYYQARQLRCEPLAAMAATTQKQLNHEETITSGDKAKSGCFRSKKLRSRTRDQSNKATSAALPGLQSGSTLYTKDSMIAEKDLIQSNRYNHLNQSVQSTSLRATQVTTGSACDTMSHTPFLTNHATNQETVDWNIQPNRLGLSGYEQFGTRYL